MVREDPTWPPTYESYQYSPPIVHAQRVAQVAQYTHTNQFAFFRDWINFVYNNDCNVRIDPKDESRTCIMWYSTYYLPLGCYLINGQTVYDEASIRWLTAPLPNWPDGDTALQDIFYEPGNPPEYNQWPEV